MNAPDIIVMEDVYKHFGHVRALDGFNLRVQPGEVVVLVGPSGSGKSTALRCINHLERPSSGRVVVDGMDVTTKHANLNAVREEVGMVFQQFNLFQHFSALKNVTLGLRHVRRWSKKRADETARAMLERVHIG